jgi:hypothetical protein
VLSPYDLCESPVRRLAGLTPPMSPVGRFGYTMLNLCFIDWGAYIEGGHVSCDLGHLGR